MFLELNYPEYLTSIVIKCKTPRSSTFLNISNFYTDYYFSSKTDENLFVVFLENVPESSEFSTI